MPDHFIRIVYSTEELIQLQEASDRAGAEVIEVATLKDGAGIRVKLKSSGQRQF